MRNDESPSETEVTRQFERELGQLIAESFARGAVVESNWEITTTVSDAPNWTVRIEKTYSDDEPAYEPQLLDE